jgi:hypothetical protein
MSPYRADLSHCEVIAGEEHSSRSQIRALVPVLGRTVVLASGGPVSGLEETHLPS